MSSYNQWSTGICHSSSGDWALWCRTCWCPCITAGAIGEILDHGNTSSEFHAVIYLSICMFTSCQWIYSWMYRSKMRREYNLPAQPCNDCCVHFCCHKCALRQEYRELRHRGFDMSLGWHGNMQRKNQGVMMPPNNHHQMQR